MYKIEEIINTVHQADCLEFMPLIPDKSIDAIITDLPYGTTACKWDTIIPFEPLWKQYKRIIKDNGAIVLTASQPFTSALVMSNIKMFKYQWVWNKIKPSTGLHAKIMPLRSHEDILVFGLGKIMYNPQMVSVKNRVGKPRLANNGEAFGGKEILRQYSNNGLQYPKTILDISNADQNNRLHPTQKPVALGRYLIRTYTNEGDLILDNTCGSGSFLVAAMLEKRNFIGIELDENYCAIARKRLEDTQKEIDSKLSF